MPGPRPILPFVRTRSAASEGGARSARATLVLSACALALLGACSRPEPPDKERPPEPQAAARHTELRDAIQAPQDKARAVEGAVEDAARAQRAAIDAAGG